ncbi:MAG: glycosyltransferase [Ruthenibacterium sp.]
MKSISVLLSIYRPNLLWLSAQLASLEAQTTADTIELLICDDCPQAPVGKLFLQQHLPSIPFTYTIHEKNVGSSLAFAQLVQQAQGSYLAFCDQDDIWLPDKLAQLRQALETSGAQLVYCDLSVIDAQGAWVAADVSQKRKRQQFLQGTDLEQQLFVKNCVYGCSLLMRTDTAKNALPLPDGMGHDHWFCLWAAHCGRIVHVQKPLVQYRLHGENQSDDLKNIATKPDYEQQRIQTMQQRVKICLPRFAHDTKMVQYLEQVQHWADARAAWFHHDITALPALLRGRHFSPKATLFELALPWLPKPIFQALIRKIQHGKL